MNDFAGAGMRLIQFTAISVVALLAISCASRTVPPDSTATIRADRDSVTGTVKGTSDTHGNAYLSIAADQYATLGLTPGAQVRIIIGQHTLTLPVVQDYGDVPAGDAMAVLHREGLTLAVRDGNFSHTHAVTKGMPFTLQVRPAHR
jgi:S-adenosylmethionine hydrolase